MRDEQFRDAARRVEASVDTPDFGQLIRRGRRRRVQRNIVGVAAATAVAATVVLGVASVRDDLAGEPPTAPATDVPSPQPTRIPTSAPTASGATAQDIVDSPQARVDGFAMDGQGRQLALWRSCNADHTSCRIAWALSDDGWRTRTVGRLSARSRPILHALTDGFVVQEWNSPGFIIGAEGEKRLLHPGDPPLPIQPGHVAAEDRFGPVVVDPKTTNEWSLLRPSEELEYGAAVIESDGTIWGEVFDSPSPRGGPIQVVWSTDLGRTWSEQFLAVGPQVAPGLLTVSGDHVAAFASSAVATVRPVRQMIVTSDGGANWTRLDPATLPFTDISSLVSTASGRLFVSDVAGTVWRSTDPSWTHFERLEGAPGTELGATGDTIYCFDGDSATVRISTDQGETWEEVEPR